MTNFIECKELTLQSAIGTSDTTIVVTGAYRYDGTIITEDDFGGAGEIVYATIEPKTDRQESLACTWVSNVAGVMTMTVTRALSGVAPYGTGGVAYNHSAGSAFIFTDSAALFNKLAAKDNDEVVTGAWEFPTPTTNPNPATKEYVDTELSDLDATLVHVTGAESISGVKTFSDAPKIPDSGDVDEAVTRGELDAEEVKLTGNQTIAGTKTFSSSPVIPDATAAQHPLTKAQYDAGATAYLSDASPTVQGAAKIDTVADTPSDPVALTATADRVGAMAGGGDFGTPDEDNQFLTEEYPLGLSVNFGDGSDGDVTISGTTTLTRDMFYNNLVVTGTLNTDGYRVFVKDTISGAGTIANNNNNNGGAGQIGGTGGGTAGAGTAGAAKGSGIWKGVAGVAGSAGSDGTPTPTAGTAGISGNKGASGAAGGNGGSGYLGEVGGTGGVAGTNDSTKPIYNIFSALHFAFYSAAATLSQYSLVGGGGGAGGSGRNTFSSGGGGGGSGGSGGIILIFAKRWTGTFTISATGGNGGNGGAGGGNSEAWGGGGGGAGGAGGVVVFLYAVKTWTGSYVLTGGNGGTGGIAGGASTTAGQNGENGATGVYYEYDITTLM